MFMKSEVDVLVTQSCPTLRDPMACSPLGSSVHGISQARIQEWVAMPFSGCLPNPSNLGFLHCRQIVYCLSQQESHLEYIRKYTILQTVFFTCHYSLKIGIPKLFYI